ncbi:MAG: DUF4397 domain-containing protein [bacterium]
MRRIVQLSVLCLAAGVVSACNPEQTVTTEVIPTAGVRFLNAVPDSAGAFGMDFRFVDIVESNAQFKIGFRNAPPASGIQVSTGIEYKNARAGARHFRVFLDDTLQTLASIVLADTTVTLEATHNYTVVLWGNGRSSGADKMKLTVIDETVGDPGAQVALRILNATNGPIEGRQYAQGGTAPTAATWANVPAFSASGYVNVAPGPIMYNIRTTGSATNLFNDLQALPGAPASSSAGAAGKIDTDALPGTTIAGSAVTMIVFPRSTAGARTPQTAAFLVPAGTFMWDRRPPRPPGA